MDYKHTDRSKVWVVKWDIMCDLKMNPMRCLPRIPDVVDCADFDIVRIWVYELNNQLEPILELCELENFTVLVTSPLFCYDQTEKPFDIN